VPARSGATVGDWENSKGVREEQGRVVAARKDWGSAVIQ